ncbi:MAG: cobalamin-dependent protein [Bacteroidia bacterium]|nr:cobalamin-dependent protein [Bacteroidia bacterium]
MNTHPVAFVAFKQFDNLGVGYLASVLSEAGYEPMIIDFQYTKEEILKILKNLKPLIVGFSVIFEYHIYEFKELMSHLRKGGVNCHFTAGGHYASLRYEELFKLIPSLDSVVRFEGEYTLLELVNTIHSGADWRKVKSIAFKDDGTLITNPLRPLEKNLDNFPVPIRSPLTEYALDKKFATILAGRGCIHDCLFCNIGEFYKQLSGPKKRIRGPAMVVREMELLHHEKECSVFLFQDDDFPVRTEKGSEWIKTFCRELKNKKLIDKIMWKINCRPDEIDYDVFAMMKNHGLYLVFLGIEDGTDNGLKRLNKHMTVAKSLEGINLLKKLEIGFDYGFMLFQPSSTYGSVKDNLDFLREICGDGYSPVTFLKMLPYFETRIEKELREEGRLKGNPGFFDYSFLDESMNHYYDFITDCLMVWLRDSDGLLNISKWARNYISVFSHYFELTPEVLLISKDVKNTVSECNIYLLDTMKELATLFESGKYNNGNYKDLNSFREEINLKHDHFIEQINNSMAKLLRIVDYQKKIAISSYLKRALW